MGNSLTLFQNKCSGPTRWEDAGDISVTVPKQPNTKIMEISLELTEIESQISKIISKDENTRTKEDLEELKRLIEYKEFKTKELNNSNGRTSGTLW